MYLLYQAALNRTPDAPGLGYWINRVDNGADITSVVSEYFLVSQEFQTLYGTNPSTSQFVNLLYQNVLHRAADSAGLSYWLGQISANGDSLLTRAGVLESFAVSGENVANVATLIAHGIAYTQPL